MSSTSRSAASGSGDLSQIIRTKLAHMDVRPAQIIKSTTGDLRPHVKARSHQPSSYEVVVSAEGSASRSGSRSKTCGGKAVVCEAQKTLFERVTAYIDWKVALLVVVVSLALFFVYKKWHLISKFGLGYGIADAGAAAVGAAVAGVPQERVEAELNAVRDGTHPATTVVASAAGAAAGAVAAPESKPYVRQEKISELLSSVKIIEEAPPAAAVAPAVALAVAPAPAPAAAPAPVQIQTPAVPASREAASRDANQVSSPSSEAVRDANSPNESVTEQIKRRLEAVGLAGEMD